MPKFIFITYNLSIGKAKLALFIELILNNVFAILYFNIGNVLYKIFLVKITFYGDGELC